MCAPACHFRSFVASGAASVSWTTSSSWATSRRSTISMAFG